MIKTAILTAGALTFLLHGASQKTTEEKPIRVLLIGNSYTYYNNLPGMISALSGGRIETRMVVRGGANLQQIWDLGDATTAIREGKWDYVVVQEHSLLGGMRVDGVEHVNEPDFFYDNARLYDAEIRKAKAKMILYLTWARRASPEQQVFLTHAYATIAQELGVQVAPVGVAWQKIRESDPAVVLHASDGTHPSPVGSYVAACVLIDTILGKKQTGLAARVSGNPIAANERPDTSRVVDLVALSPERAEQLQKVAAESVLPPPGPKPVYPVRASLPAVKRPFTAQDLGGVWRGSLKFFAFPVNAELKLNTDGTQCSGQFAIWTLNDDRRLRTPISGCRITDAGVTFSVPDYRGVGPGENYWSHFTGEALVGWADYRGIAKSSRLMGSFELKRQKDPPR
jgi:hypothetical protein